MSCLFQVEESFLNSFCNHCLCAFKLMESSPSGISGAQFISPRFLNYFVMLLFASDILRFNSAVGNLFFLLTSRILSYILFDQACHPSPIQDLSLGNININFWATCFRSAAEGLSVYLEILIAKWFSNSHFSVHCKESSVKAFVKLEEKRSELIWKSLGHGYFLILKQLLSILEHNSGSSSVSFKEVSCDDLFGVQGGYKENKKHMLYSLCINY